jgi:hypothetical protein
VNEAIVVVGWLRRRRNSYAASTGTLYESNSLIF